MGRKKLSEMIAEAPETVVEMPRARGAAGAAKREVLTITMSPDEKKLVSGAAAALGLPVATYIRMKALAAAKGGAGE